MKNSNPYKISGKKKWENLLWTISFSAVIGLGIWVWISDKKTSVSNENYTFFADLMNQEESTDSVLPETVLPETVLPDSVLSETVLPEKKSENLDTINAGKKNPTVKEASPKTTLPKTTSPESSNLPITITLKKGELLTLISDKYYGNKIFWVYIYKENINSIKNPGKISAGTRIVIPRPEKYAIDASNENSLAKAKALQYEIISNQPATN
jgi:hypothetical protein